MHSNAMLLHKQTVEGTLSKRISLVSFLVNVLYSIGPSCRILWCGKGDFGNKIGNHECEKNHASPFTIWCTDASEQGILHLRHFDNARASLAALEARDAIRRGPSSARNVASLRTTNLPKKMLFSESDWRYNFHMLAAFRWTGACCTYSKGLNTFLRSWLPSFSTWVTIETCNKMSSRLVCCYKNKMLSRSKRMRWIAWTISLSPCIKQAECGGQNVQLVSKEQSNAQSSTHQARAPYLRVDVV